MAHAYQLAYGKRCKLDNLGVAAGRLSCFSLLASHIVGGDGSGMAPLGAWSSVLACSTRTICPSTLGNLDADDFLLLVMDGKWILTAGAWLLGSILGRSWRLPYGMRGQH